MVTRQQTNRVIFHHSLSDVASAEIIREWHMMRGFDDIGYHYVIRKSGKIEHGRDIKRIGAHAVGRNHDSIGICFEGDFRKTEPTEEQYKSAGLVYHGVCRQYSKKLNVEYHRENDNPCPGVKLDKKKLENILEGAYDG